MLNSLNKPTKIRLIFLISALFFFILLTVVFSYTGVHVYKTVEQNNIRQEISDVHEYFSELIRTSDTAEIRTENINENISALVITTYQNGKNYENFFFTQDGELKKYTSAKNAPADVSQAEAVMPLRNAKFVMTGGDLLEIRFIASDNTMRVVSFYIYNY